MSGVSFSAQDDCADIDTLLLKDIPYLCSLSRLFADVLRRGCDVTHMENGDILVTERKVVYTIYKWDRNKRAFVKQSNGAYPL